MPPEPDPAWLRRAAQRAESEPFFLASVLAAYRTLEGIDEQELVRQLGCSVERLPLLALCRRPRAEAPRFRQDVEQIAAYAGVDAGRLAALVRRVDAVTALRHMPTAQQRAGTLLAAARDQESATEEGRSAADREEPEATDDAGR